MKRVLMTADTVGGVWNYALALIRALEEWEFALCTMGAPLSASQQREISTLKNARLFPSSFKLEWMDDPWGDVDAASEWLLEIAARFQPDIIHLNGYSHASLPWSAPVIVVAHSCVLSWWRAVKHENAPSRFDEYQGRVAAGLNAADLVIAPSHAMLHSLSGNYDAQFIGRVIHNGCDASHFQAADKSPRILAAGRIWDEAKNLRALDRAAPFLPWPIEIAGDASAPSGSAVELFHARALGKLTPADLVYALRHASIFAAPARYEPFGLAILEATLSGCALVLGDIPSLRELWNGVALFVDPDDDEQLTRTLNELIGDEPLRADLSMRARQRALTFSGERMAAGYRAAYFKCMEKAKVAA